MQRSSRGRFDVLVEGRRTLSQAQYAIPTTRAAGAPQLIVGFYGSAGSDLLADALRAFSERHPSYTVSVREPPFGSIDAILSSEVSVAFTRLKPGQTELEVEVIAREPRVVALAVAHPLSDRGTLTFAELAEESFITNPVMCDHGARHPRWLAEQGRHALPGRVAAQSGGRARDPDVGRGRPRRLLRALSGRRPPRARRRRLRAREGRRARCRVARLAGRCRGPGAGGVHRDRARTCLTLKRRTADRPSALVEQRVDRHRDPAAGAGRRIELPGLLAGTGDVAKPLHLLGEKARGLTVSVRVAVRAMVVAHRHV